MNITDEVKGNACVVSLQGRLDNESTQGFQERITAIIDGGQTRLVVNMSGLDYISSVGLRAFLLASKKLKPLNGKLLMAGMQTHIQEVFDIAGFSSLFPAFSTEEEAIKQLG